jgi:cytochrome c peroxidase
MKFALILSLLSFFAIASTQLILENIIEFPSHFPKPVYDFKKNPLSKEKVELGRVLFFDPILSKDKSISCASCHSSFNAFAHTDHDLSHGIGDSIGNRNAPALFNLAWQSSFMWDGAVNHLDVQALAPITHPKEMGEDLETVVRKLQASKIYPKLFFKAFNDSIITGERVLKSLSQFQLTLISANSKYDRVKEGIENFTEQ